MKPAHLVTVAVTCAIASVVAFLAFGPVAPRSDTSSRAAREPTEAPPARGPARDDVGAGVETPERSKDERTDKKPAPARTYAPAPPPPTVGSQAPAAAPRPPAEPGRTLSNLQRDKMTEMLDPSGGPIGAVTILTPAGDAEARRYADEIGAILTERGWRVFRSEVPSAFDGIRIRASTPASPAAARIQQALAEGGVEVSAEFQANIADIQLFVGRRS